MATGAASANCPRRSENPPAARFFTHLSFRMAFSGVEKRGMSGWARRKTYFISEAAQIGFVVVAATKIQRLPDSALILRNGDSAGR